jgi:glycosyltransferase involved in cell wall biosynthesis
MNRKKPIVLVFTRYYLPGYKAGGPPRSISNMVEALGNELDFRIVTSDRDASDVEAYPEVTEGTWTAVGKAQVLYLAPARKRFLRIATILLTVPHDILYLNSFFDPVFTQTLLLARRLGLGSDARCIIAPRGELAEGALALKSAKKKAFLFVARATGLYRNLEWHASSRHEAADIRRALGKVVRHIKVASDVPDMTTRSLRSFVPRTPGEPLRIVFLSRISPMKNLDFALEVLWRVRVPVRFDIYGMVDDDAYWRRCQEIMATLPSNVEAVWHGCIPHSEVAETLARYDLFLLPTRGESYGHAIFEALSVGTPVLIADTTPWRGLEEKRIGWDLPLSNPGDFADRIEKAFAFDADEQVQRRRLINAFANDYRQRQTFVAQNLSLFAPCEQHSVGGGEC